MKRLCLLLVIALFFSTVSAETVFERSFQEMGFESIESDGASIENCAYWNFLYPENIDLTEEGLYPLFSINISFSPLQSDTAGASIKLNQGKENKVYIRDMHCEEDNCWQRILLDKSQLLEENTLRICGITSNTTTNIVVNNTSFIGAYLQPYFEGFEKTVSQKNLEQGEEIEISIKIKNSGSEAGEITIKRMRPLFEEIKDIVIFDVLKGDGEWTGTIGAGETKEINYSIRPNIVSRITLPAAAASYKNIFGETEELKSNYPFIWVSAPKKELTTSFGKEGEIFTVGASTQIEVKVINSGNWSVEQAELNLNPETGLEISENKLYITNLGPGESSTFTITARGNSEGDHKIGCEISFMDGNTAVCDGTSIAFEEQEIEPLIFAAGFFLLVGAGIYLFIHFKG